MLFLGIINIFVVICIFLVSINIVYATLSGAPWLPTGKKSINRFLKLTDIKPGQIMYDLGCGDGRIVFAAAAAGANAQGFEISFLPFITAKFFKIFQKNKSKIKISFQNIWNVNLSNADIIYIWLLPETHTALRKKFEAELKNGCKIISYIWPINGWQPKLIDLSKGSPPLFLYEKGLT